MATTAIARGRRETRKRETRRRILEAAFQLFQERGYMVTSLAQIARHSRVSPRTVSNYFPTKRTSSSPTPRRCWRSSRRP